VRRFSGGVCRLFCLRRLHKALYNPFLKITCCLRLQKNQPLIFERLHQQAEKMKWPVSDSV
jgi:hypothetical protein